MKSPVLARTGAFLARRPIIDTYGREWNGKLEKKLIEEGGGAGCCCCFEEGGINLNLTAVL